MEFFIFIVAFAIIGGIIGLIIEKTNNLHNFLKENNFYPDVVLFIISAFSPLLLHSRDGLYFLMGIVGSFILISYLIKFIKFIFFYIELYLLKAKGIKTHIKYDVAFSFSGEDRKIVNKLAKYLSKNGFSVFYDDYEKSNLWGKDLYSYLSDIYRNKARFCVIVVSEHYKRKLWTNHELRSAQSRALNENYEYILPVRVDNTQLPGLLDTTAYLDLRKESLASIAILLEHKIENINLMEKLGSGKVSYNMLASLENSYSPEKQELNINAIKTLLKKIKLFDLVSSSLIALVYFLSITAIGFSLYEDFPTYTNIAIFFLAIVTILFLAVRYSFKKWLAKLIRSLDLSQKDLIYLKQIIPIKAIKSKYIFKKTNIIIDKIQKNGY